MLWDVARREQLGAAPLPLFENSVRSVAFSPDGKTLAAGYGYGVGRSGVVVWDVGRRERLVDQPLPVAEGKVCSVAFSPDGKTLAASYASGGRGGVVLWDPARRERLANVPLLVAEGNVTGVAFSPDGKTLAAGYTSKTFFGGEGGLVLWDVGRRERLDDKQPLTVGKGWVLGVAISPDGTTLAASYCRRGGAGVVLCDVGRCQRLASGPLPLVEGVVKRMAFSPDGKTLPPASAASSGTGWSCGTWGGASGWQTSRCLWPRASSPAWPSVQTARP